VATKLTTAKVSLRLTVRWFSAGLLFMGINTVLLYGLVHWLRLNVPLATFICAETCTLLRYVVNETWVFEGRVLSWTRLWQYHVVNGGAFAVWWVCANVLNALGVNYLLASIVAVGFSTGVSFLSNIFWVWRPKKPARALEP
jgi:putative flippase GtrA